MKKDVCVTESPCHTAELTQHCESMILQLRKKITQGDKTGTSNGSGGGKWGSEKEKQADLKYFRRRMDKIY